MKYQRGPLTLNVTAFRQEFQQLPAQHVQRHRLPRPDDQRLLEPICGDAATDQHRGAARLNAGARDRRLRGRRRRPGRDLAGRRDRGRSGRGATWCSPSASPLPTRAIGTIWSAATAARRSIRRCACCPATICPTRPSIVATGVDRLDAADRQFAACRGLVYVDARVTDDYNTGSDLFPQKAAGQLRRRQRPPRHPRAPSSAGRSSCGRRTCSTPIMRRSRSTRRSRRARPRRRSSIRNSPAGGRSSPPSSPSRGPTASPAASASERPAKSEKALAGDGGGLFLWLRPPRGRAAPATPP